MRRALLIAALSGTLLAGGTVAVTAIGAQGADDPAATTAAPLTTTTTTTGAPHQRRARGADDGVAHDANDDRGAGVEAGDDSGGHGGRGGGGHGGHGGDD
jgi:hypothetical protein